jgi:tellurite resistance protein TerC
VIVQPWVWALTMVVLVAILLVDLLVIGRRPHEPSMRESTLWVIFYVALACLFGALLYVFQGPRESGEFFAGWITEYSLSVDNLFIFMIIMSRFAVPRAYQQKVLLVGIVLALVMRGGFIAAGAAVIGRFSWVFYLFGAFLVYTAVRLLTQHEDLAGDGEFKENVVVRWARRVLPVSRGYDGARVVTHQAGRWLVTPMLIVMITIGTTDLLFALDSIPAIFGLTRYAYLVFAANVFALMGLRQLYFLIGGLLRRLVYLNVGLAVILAFIGVKLALDAMHENALPFLNGGDPIGWAPHVPIWLSLVVILAALGVTTVASLIKSARTARSRPAAPAGTCEQRSS